MYGIDSCYRGAALKAKENEIYIGSEIFPTGRKQFWATVAIDCVPRSRKATEKCIE